MSSNHTSPHARRRGLLVAWSVAAAVGLLLAVGVLLITEGRSPSGSVHAPSALGAAGSERPGYHHGVGRFASSASPSAATATPSRTPSPTPRRTTATPSSKVVAYEAQVLSLVNQQRAANGCAAVTADSRLANAARAHSADMAARGYFDHTTPDGVQFSARITAAGYAWSSAGENIAMGQPDPASVMNAWMNSAGHRANILNCGYKNLGVGLAYNSRGTPYWTQDFASPR